MRLVDDRLVTPGAHSIYSYEVCVCVFQKQGKKLRREGKDKWIDFAGKVRREVIYAQWVWDCVLILTLCCTAWERECG